jgi:hypothetical protein
MKQNSSSVPARNDDARPAREAGRTVRNGRVLLIAAVALAAAGLLSLAAVLVSAWLGVQPWQGFMAAAYLCLPLGFLLMIASVVIGVISRGRS